MIFTLFFACILPGKDLIGDSDRPLEPPLNGLDSNSASNDGEADNFSELSVSVDGNDINVEHHGVDLPCDFDAAEMTIYIDDVEFYVEVIYTEREPEGCYQDLEYTLDFSDYSSGFYRLEAHGDETSFEFE